MIRLECNFDSIVLATKVDVIVYLPNKVDYMKQVTDFRENYSFKPFKTAFLLHGMWDSADQWVENTNIVRLAQDENLALVIPSVGNSFYIDTVYGARYSKYFIEELLGFVRALFPLSDKKEDNYLIGTSMGGYGAIRFSLLYPELFSKVFSLSATPDISFAARFMHTLGVRPDYVVGNWKDLKGSEKDLWKIAEDAVKGHDPAEFPPIFFVCGNNDYLNHGALKFKEHIDALGIRNEYKIYEGSHDWGFWSDHLKEGLDWLLDKKSED